MPSVNVVCVKTMHSPTGWSITDVMEVVGKKRRPLLFTQIGQAVNLETVDLKAYKRSEHSGQIRNLLSSGALTMVQRDVSEALLRKIEEARNALNIPNHDGAGLRMVETVELEPGVTVAVGNYPEDMPNPIEQPVLTPAPAAAPIEPGAAAGKGASLSVEEVEDFEVSSEPGPAAAREEKPAPKPAIVDQDLSKAAGNPHSDWKLNKSFSDQKRFILASQDADLLRFVATTDDEAVFRDLAKKRLQQSGL